MLRMGRSPRVEPNEQEKAQGNQTQPPVNQPAQVARAQTPQNFQQSAPARPVEPPARVEPERTPTQPRAVTETEALARDLREGIMSGFLGTGTLLTGEADFKGMLRIDGHFTGRITSDKGTLIVSAGGRVDADIEVGTAKVNGVVNGDITASERIEMGRSAEVRGDIRTPVLVVEQGAIFEGGCRMAQPKAEPEKTPKAPEKTSAQSPTTTNKPRAATPLPAQTQPLKVSLPATEGGSQTPAVGVSKSAS